MLRGGRFFENMVTRCIMAYAVVQAVVHCKSKNKPL